MFNPILAGAKILWTNPNPNSSISAATNITFNSSDYDEIIWFWRLSTANNYMQSTRHLKGYGTRLIYGAFHRPIVRNTDTSYTIGLNSENLSQNAIPVYAVGIKTGLF